MLTMHNFSAKCMVAPGTRVEKADEMKKANVFVGGLALWLQLALIAHHIQIRSTA